MCRIHVATKSLNERFDLMLQCIVANSFYPWRLQLDEEINFREGFLKILLMSSSYDSDERENIGIQFSLGISEGLHFSFEIQCERRAFEELLLSTVDFLSLGTVLLFFNKYFSLSLSSISSFLTLKERAHSFEVFFSSSINRNLA